MKSNWEIKKIDDVCNVEYGTRVVRKRDGGTIYTVYGGGGATFSMDTFNRESRMVIGRFAMSEKCTRFVQGKFFLNDSGLTLSPKNTTQLLQEFLDWQILFLNDSIYSLAKGAAQKNLDVPAFRNLEIVFPDSINEQKRIVKILDEAFEKIDRAKAFSEKNLQNSKEVFEAYLQNVFANPSESWEEKALGEVYDVRDGTHDSPKYQKEGYALITSKNLKDGNLDYQKIKYISEKDFKKINDRSKVHKGDILFAMIGTIGNPVVVDVDPDFAIKNVALFKIPKDQDSYFLKYFLDSKFVIDKMMNEAKGTTQQFVGLGYLRDFKIKIPDLNTQKMIVKKLDSFSEQTKKLEANYKQKIADLDELKKSVLSKAFAGEL
jgi:type I restriction enzyme S subunit